MVLPKAGERMEMPFGVSACSQTGCGLMDASTLGKIDIQVLTPLFSSTDLYEYLLDIAGRACR